MQAIRDWLNGPQDFSAGVALYRQHGDGALAKMLAQGASEYRMRRLTDALRAILRAAPVAGAPACVGALPAIAAVIAVDKLFDECTMPEVRVDEAADSYRDQWLPLYAEMQHLRARLEDAESDVQRGEWAHRILDLEAQCARIWERRDYELRTGQKMPVDAVAEALVVVDKNALQRRLNNVRTYITKKGKRLAVEPLNAQLAADIEALITERDALEKALNNG